jgi:hypothetical protein
MEKCTKEASKIYEEVMKTETGVRTPEEDTRPVTVGGKFANSGGSF